MWKKYPENDIFFIKNKKEQIAKVALLIAKELNNLKILAVVNQLKR